MYILVPRSNGNVFNEVSGGVEVAMQQFLAMMIITIKLQKNERCVNISSSAKRSIRVYPNIAV